MSTIEKSMHKDKGPDKTNMQHYDKGNAAAMGSVHPGPSEAGRCGNGDGNGKGNARKFVFGVVSSVYSVIRHVSFTCRLYGERATERRTKSNNNNKMTNAKTLVKVFHLDSVQP